MSSLILRTATRVVSPLIIVLSVYFFLRGHDSPGGGFIAGLIAAAGIVLRTLSGQRSEGFLTNLTGQHLVAFGLIVAVAAGVFALIVQGAFLGPGIWTQDIPAIGELKVTISMFFDAGVYFIVAGLVLAVARHLGEERL